MLGLGLPEGDGLADLGHDLAGPQARGLDVGDRVLGDLALLVARVEDLRAVARADVVALAVLRRRVVDLEEELEDVPVGDALGVEDDLDRLGVTGMVPVGRVLVLPAGVSDPGGDDSVAAGAAAPGRPRSSLPRGSRSRRCRSSRSPSFEALRPAQSEAFDRTPTTAAHSPVRPWPTASDAPAPHPAVVACASAEGLWRLTIAGASCTRSSFSSASTMNRAKSTRRVMSLWRIGVADVAAPHRQALAGALLQAAAPHDGPAGVAGEDAPRRLDLVVEVGEAGEPGEAPADVDQGLELPRVDVLAVEGDVPPAREHQPCARLGVVEHRLRGPGRVAVHAARDEHDEDAVAARDRPLDDVAVVGRAGDDR